jgi:amino acid adenylation domain-containing protein
MIAANAAAHPEQVIVKDQHGAWTWRQLMRRAADYAAFVSAARVPADGVVAIGVGRSRESIAAMLGCTLAGRGFAPLSVDQPEARLDAALSRLEATFVFVDDPARAAPDAKVCGRSAIFPASAVGDAACAMPPDDPDKVLYVLFTSGSTGQPKGVIATHSNILNTILWGEEILDWAADDVIGLAVNIYFDIAMFDIFTGLCLNVPLAIVSKSGDVVQTCQEISDFGVTSIFAAPVFFSQFVRANVLGNPRLDSLRRIVSGGDFFPPAHILAWREHRPGLDIYNVWGPTETSIVNTMHLVDERDLPALRQGISAPVGRAHTRMPFVLLDESLNVVDTVDAKGEICMQGACVTQGYLNDVERTVAAYIEVGGLRTYRTGDLGSVDAAGNLHVHGRIGSLIKVAGYRIDVGEVEGAAARWPDVHAAATFVREVADGIQELWLAVELRQPGSAFDIFQFKKQLREILPAYMVPKRVFVMDRLPTTPNLKIDRRAVAAAFANA